MLHLPHALPQVHRSFSRTIALVGLSISAIAPLQLPLMAQPAEPTATPSVPASPRSSALCRITKSNAARFASNDLGSTPLSSIPKGTPVILARLPEAGNPLVEVTSPSQYAGFVPIAALEACPAPPPPPPSASQCRRVLARVFPDVQTINLRSGPSTSKDIVGFVARNASVYLVTNGNTVKSTNDGTYSWVQVDVPRTQVAGVNPDGLFKITATTTPAEVWMFNTKADRPGLSNLGLCPSTAR